MIDTDWTDSDGRVIVEPLKSPVNGTDEPIDGAVMEINDKIYTYNASTKDWAVETKIESPD